MLSKGHQDWTTVRVADLPNLFRTGRIGFEIDAIKKIDTDSGRTFVCAQIGVSCVSSS